MERELAEKQLERKKLAGKVEKKVAENNKLKSSLTHFKDETCHLKSICLATGLCDLIGSVLAIIWASLTDPVQLLNVIASSAAVASWAIAAVLAYYRKQ